jgi:hypothetical protein
VRDGAVTKKGTTVKGGAVAKRVTTVAKSRAAVVVKSRAVVKSGAQPTNTYADKFSRAHKGMFVSGYAETRRVTLYPTLEMAMEACLQSKNATGITFEPDVQMFALRKSAVFCKSPIPAEISWLRL